MGSSIQAHMYTHADLESMHLHSADGTDIKILEYNILQSVLETEHELETVLFGVRIPVGPVPVAGVVRLVLDFSCRDAESDGLVRFGGDLHTTQSS